MLILQLLVLLIIANGTPIIVKNIFGKRFAFPVDGGINFFDKKPLLGNSKTVRGIISSLIVTPVGAVLVGLEWYIGIVVSGMSMLGDLFSSFIKRRFNMPPSSMALGIDQIPEALFPLLACQLLLPLTTASIVFIVILFFITELLLSRLLYKLKIRDEPY